MSISEKLTKLTTDITNAYNSIQTKNGTIPANKNTENLASAIESIEGVKVYTVTFNSNGGTEVANQIIVSGQTAKEPDTPTKTGYKFRYWTLNGVEYDFDTPITSNVTLVAEWRETLVPADCIELEYIESPSTQYIDTGIILNSNIKIEDWINGEGLNGSDGTGSMFRFKYGFNNNYFLAYGSNVNFLKYSDNPKDLNIFYKFTMAKGIQKIEPDILSYTDNTTLSSYPTKTITLFALREGSGDMNYNKFSASKRQKCKIYEGETLIRNFIPVLDSNNIACLYDSVTQTFFYNQGTGSFNAGPVVV